MAWMDWNLPCNVCGKFKDYRHGEHLTLIAVTDVGPIRVCEDCEGIVAPVLEWMGEKIENGYYKE